jgi:outer membrane protein insertion porin family
MHMTLSVAGGNYLSRLVFMSALALTAISAFAQAQTVDPKMAACPDPDTNAAELTLHFKSLGNNCIRLTGGYASLSGSFVGLSYSTRNRLHLGETLSLSSQYGVRTRRVQLGFNKASLFGRPIGTGATFYGQRFHYNQGRESSIFAFQRDIPEFNELGKDNLLNYISHSYGVTAFVQYPIPGTFSHVRLTYSHDVSDFTTLTTSTGEYFGYLDVFGEKKVTACNLSDIFQYLQCIAGPNVLKDIHTNKLTPSFTYNTVNHPIQPTRGTAISISTAIAAGGDVHTIEPSIDAKYFHPGFKNGHVIGIHLSGRVLIGYGTPVPPPFDRYYMGGENDVRGFDSWGIGPIAYMPSSATVNVLNNDGSQRIQKQFVNGETIFTNVTITIPIYRFVSVGGDTKVVTNFEYRIPIAGPLTLALFRMWA